MIFAKYTENVSKYLNNFKYFLVLTGVCYLLMILPILISNLFPLTDFYNHVARYFILSRGAEIFGLQNNYASHWGIIPNIGLDIISLFLFKIFSPYFAAKIVLLLIVSTQYFGIIFLNFTLTKKIPWFQAILTAPLVYSFILIWGFTNFLLGLGLCFWGAGIWTLLRGARTRLLCVSAPFALLIFFTHAFAFLTYVMLISSIEFGYWFYSLTRDRNTALKSGAYILIVSISPVVLFFFSRTSVAAVGELDKASNLTRIAKSGGLVARISEIASHRIATILRVEDGPNYLFDSLVFLLTAGILAIMLRQGWLRIYTVVIPGLILSAIATVLTPPSLFHVAYVSDRMPLYFAFVFVASLVVQEKALRSAGFFGAVLALIALSIVRLGVTAVWWRSYDRDLADFQRVAAAIPEGALVNFVAPEGMDRDVDLRACGMFSPRLVIDRHAFVPLFSDPTQQPLLLVGQLKKATESLPARAPSVGLRKGPVGQEIGENENAGFQYILICKRDEHTKLNLVGQDVVAASGRLSVIHSPKAD